MACYHPISAWQVRGSREVIFAERGDCDTLTLPCGRCVGCRLERSRQWAVRCMHEASLYGSENEYVTLTYSDENLPAYGSLCYADFQKFMKRLRKFYSGRQVRFYMCGEYGDKEDRPHYHALLFNCWFADRKYWKRSNGYPLYRSDVLEKLWGLGHCWTGSVTFQSAGYVARYVMKKVVGDRAKAHYEALDLGSGEIVTRVCEFNHMSLGGRNGAGGIGKRWFEKFSGDVYPRGKVVVNGVEAQSPRYYDKLYAGVDGASSELLAFQRDMAARSRFGDNTDDRLKVKEIVANARVGFLKREL